MEIERHLRRICEELYKCISFVNLEQDKAGGKRVLCHYFKCEKPILGNCVKSYGSYYHQSCVWVSTKMESLLFHFRNEHDDLIFTGELKNMDKEDAVCFGCKEPVMGPGYECSDFECKFLLHQSCAKLPVKSQKFSHADHTLYLSEPENVCCNACDKNCNGCFSYRCDECEFNLDLKCAKSLRIDTTGKCDHERLSLIKLIQFTCDACGNEGKGVAALCNNCLILTHEQCHQFSKRVRLETHRHPLYVTYSLLEVKDYDEVFCKLCRQKVRTGAYFCKRCDYVTHIKCGRHFIDSESKHRDDSGSEDEGEIDAGFEEGAESIQHFGHNHTLSLSNEEFMGDKRCDACVELISAPFYSCRECNNFFLHNKCVHLPRKKKHSIHKHPLTLISQIPSFVGVFRCEACSRFCQGFCYSCSECKFKLDVRCFSLSETFKYEGHPHSLFLAVYQRDRKKRCSACLHPRYPYGYDKLFVCTKCEFALCFKCSILTFPARHRFDAHRLKFTRVDEANDEDYYCLICEKKRDPENWIYFCEKCDFSAHIECVIGQHPFMKFGSFFKWENHEHPLTFVLKDEFSSPCDGCGSAFYPRPSKCSECEFGSKAFCAPALECAECKFSVHTNSICVQDKGLPPPEQNERLLGGGWRLFF